jgi:hypothetical protein
MLDVHPAPHAAHSWREFFIHIATIVIGLIIAVGLEQMVLSIHHRHQREALEDSLRTESLQNRRLAQYDFASVNEVRRNIRLNMAVLDHSDNKPFTPIPPPHDTFLPFINSAWLNARDNGTLTLLPEKLVESYWKVDFLTQTSAAAIESIGDARMKVNSLLHLHATPAELTPTERNDLLRAYSEEDQQIGNFSYILMGFDYMNEAALSGHTPTIAEVARESQRAQQTEGQPPQP